MGFSDGYVRGYSKSGQVIFSEQLHLEAVTKLSFMWPSPAPRNSAYQVDSIMCLCVHGRGGGGAIYLQKGLVKWGIHQHSHTFMC